VENHTIPPLDPRRNPAEAMPLILDALRVLADELRALRADLRAGRRREDEYRGVYLNAKFPHGRATDRWRRRG
jgi:hypothetical protein